MYQNIYYDRTTNNIHLWDDETGYKKTSFVRYAYVPDDHGSYISLDGKRLKRVHDWDKNLPEIPGAIYESDVYPEMRTLIDLYTDSDNPSKNHNVVTFDIEVSMEGGVSTPEEANNEITAISLYSDKLNHSYCYVLDKNLEILPTEQDNVTIQSFVTEDELLLAFIQLFKTIKPTILTGWNTSFFDIPYLCNRLFKLFGEYIAKQLSPINIVKVSNDGKYKIAGVSCLDYLDIYKKFTYSEEPSYTLDAISNKELGRGKIKYDGSLTDLFKSDINKYVAYNLEDVYLVRDLETKLQFFALVKAICHKGHVPYEDIFMTSKFLDGAALTYLKQINIIAPNKKKIQKLELFETHFRGEKIIKVKQTIPNETPSIGILKFQKSATAYIECEYERYDGNSFYLKEQLDDDVLTSYDMVVGLAGAYVKEPVLGLHEWVYDIDATSLYPSEIRSLNISPETKYGKIDNFELDIFVARTEYNWYVNINNKKQILTTTELHDFLNSKNLSISAIGILYTLDKRGFLPSILDKWFAERSEYKNLMKKFNKEGDKEMYQLYYTKQYTQKILLNSFYGVLAVPSFRFYDKENAASITAGGQALIKFTHSLVNKYYNYKLGTNVDYALAADTDSGFYSAVPLLELQHPTYKSLTDDKITQLVLQITGEIETLVNKSYDVYAKRYHCISSHCFNIKQEVVARSSLFVAKKRYAQLVINSEGVPVNKLEIKGLDVVRSDFPTAFRSFMKGMLIDILNKATAEECDNKIQTFRKEMKSLPLLDIMIPSGVKNIRKYDAIKSENIFKLPKGTPVHTKAAMVYNDFLTYIKSNNTERVNNGAKIKYAFLIENPLQLDSCALKGYNDPQEIVDYITQYIDRSAIFESKLKNKINDFYGALGWGVYNDSPIVTNFFSF